MTEVGNPKGDQHQGLAAAQLTRRKAAGSEAAEEHRRQVMRENAVQDAVSPRVSIPSKGRKRGRSLRTIATYHDATLRCRVGSSKQR